MILRFLSTWALVFLPCLALQARTPNLVFILADDLGWADTSLYGQTRLYETPNIERLARRGMTFNRAYTASPLCSPTRSSILTGLSPARTGITAPQSHLPKVILKAEPGLKAPPGKKTVQPVAASRLDTRHQTLGKTLKNAGYTCGHFGKWHLGKSPYSPLEHGFDVDIPHWPGPGPAGSYVAPWKYPDFDPDTPNQHIEDRMAREAAQFMEKNRDQPFFLNYWMFSVHAPFDAKPELVEKYRGRIDPDDPQRSPTYAAMIESMDDAVGTLLDTLDRLELTRDTIIIFFSDNGGNMYNEVDGTTPTSNAPLRGGKATMFEGGVRVPLVVSWPGQVEPDSRSESLVSSDDFYPTLLEMLGMEPEPDQKFDGISFLPALLGQPFERGPVYTYFPHDPPVPDWIPPSAAIYEDNWKLVRVFHGGDEGRHRYFLFDLESDLGESNNLATRAPDRVKAMDAKLEAYLERTNALLPVPNPDFDLSQYRPEMEGVGRVRTKAKPKAKAKSGKKVDDEFPGLLGWKARGCKANVSNGVVTIKGTSDSPFLGVGAGNLSAPATAKIRVRCTSPGAGKIEWNPHQPEKGTTSFQVKGGDKWETIFVEIPVELESLGIFRVYLPAQNQAIEVDWISLGSSPGSERTWSY